MKISLNEVGGLVLKAARGAGYAIGHAEDLSRLAMFLAGTGQSLKLVDAALAAGSNAPTVTWDDALVVIGAGSNLIAGVIARDALLSGVAKAVMSDEAQVEMAKVLLASEGYVPNADGLTLRMGGASEAPKPSGPVDLDDRYFAAWGALAAKTYVPETEASRLAGAGAGLTDND